MSATEELRRMLDERGVEWESTGWPAEDQTFYEAGGVGFIAIGLDDEFGDSRMRVCFEDYMTPEQAVEATLGREPDDAAMTKLHEQMNVALFKYEQAQGIEKRDGDEAIVVPFVVKMHSLLEAAATLGRGTCKPILNSEYKHAPYINDWIVCSACGTKLAERFGIVWQRYCPYCGARITEVTDG